MDRRTFLMVAGAGGAGLMMQLPRLASAVAADTVAVSAAVPRLIYFPECRPGAHVLPIYCSTKELCAVQLSWLPKPSELESKGLICVLFSNGRAFEFPADSSYLSLAEKHGGRVRREALLVKNLISWTLDGFRLRMRSTTTKHTPQALRQDFERLQEEDVLGSATLGALFRLATELELQPPVTRVAWLKDQAHFLVERRPAPK